MIRPLNAVATALLLAAAAACAPMTDPGPTRELTTLPRELTAAEVTVRDASNAFAFGLFRRAGAADPGGNVFVSPLSVSMSLGMVLNGAAGETRRQMQEALGFGDAELSAVQAGYRDLIALLRGLDGTTGFQLANSIWHDEAFPFEPSFLDAGRTWFDAEIRPVDFTDGEATKAQVNAWVKEKTNGRIPMIVDEVNPDDVMYLINAIWFKGTWRSRFDPAATHEASFRTATGASQTVRMMTQEVDSSAGFRAYADADVEAGELSYGNGAFAMTIVMPREGGDLAALEASLTQERWNAIVAGLAPRRGWDVALPKFTLTYERELKEDLAAMGIQDLFDPGRADLSGMSADPRLYVGFVKHKTFVLVDEEGTEAAAVTNTGIRVTSLPPGFRVNRPFVFAIRERLSGTILFLGRITSIPQP